MSETRGRADAQSALTEAARTGATLRFLYRAAADARPEWRTRRISRVAPPYFYAATPKRSGIRYRLDRVVAVDVPQPARPPAAITPNIRSPYALTPKPRPTPPPPRKPSKAGWWWAAAAAVVVVTLWWPSDETPSTESTYTPPVANASLLPSGGTVGVNVTRATAAPTVASRSVSQAGVTQSSTNRIAAAPPCASYDCDCADFASREQLMLVFNSTPGDPHRLDADSDGVPCEDGVGGGSAGSGTTTTAPGTFIPYEGNGGGPTLCRDGTYSRSSGRGTCSHHGGIAR